jgi:hypothetical protein
MLFVPSSRHRLTLLSAAPDWISFSSNAPDHISSFSTVMDSMSSSSDVWLCPSSSAHWAWMAVTQRVQESRSTQWLTVMTLVPVLAQHD